MNSRSACPGSSALPLSLNSLQVTIETSLKTFFVFFLSIFFVDFSNLEFSVEAAISLSFDSFSILIEHLEILFLNIFSTCGKKCLDFSVGKYLEICVWTLSILNLVQNRLSRSVFTFFDSDCNFGFFFPTF